MVVSDLSGQRIKGYVLREQLGSGGFGAVYRAYQEDVQREVAIKIILPHYANQPDFIRRFEAEAQTIAQLEHPYIVPMHDYWRDPHGAYLVMRLLRGGSIRDVLRQHHMFDVERIAVLLGHIASALHHAHQQQVIHRDIKPDNILLDESGIAYLADFGIAKNLSQETNGARKEIVGSLDYLSPEQARSEPITARTDIYSMGVVLYELLVGEHPFHEVSSVERMYKHISDPLPEITSLEPDLNEAMNEIIQRATQKNPKDRYPDVLSLARDFAEAAQMTISSSKSVYETLTSRELDILRLVADDLTNQEIAEKLVVEHSTIRWYIRQINKKLRVFSREELKRKVAELGWFDAETSTTDATPSQIALLWDEIENPYKGLRAFERGEAQDFFGREEFVERLIWRMQEADPYQRFLAIVGPSGSGKSSVARAGLLPALVKNAIAGSDHWFCIDMIPGDSPFDALETALIRIAADQAMNLHDQINRDERGLVRAADLILPKDKSELLLLIDQFEEVFTLVMEEAKRRRFLDLLLATVTAPHSRVRIVVTLRADFYDRPLRYPKFGEMLRARMETILPLTAQGIERAILGPVERMGMVFEDGLIAQIVSETNYQPGALPLLQFALTALFDLREGHKLTHQVYQQIGGVGGALAKRIEDIYQQLDPEAQEAVRQLFLRLVTLGEGAEDTRRRIPRNELAAIAQDADLMEDLIDFLAQERFLALDNDPATRAPMVEVAHEAILREWERLRAWINDSRAELRLQQQLGRLVEDWHKANQEPSYLLRGARLEQFEAWSQTTTLTLTPSEATFLKASQQARNDYLAAEQLRQERETALETRAKRIFQILAVVLFIVAIGGFALAAFAFDQQRQTQTALVAAEASDAESRELALVNASRAMLVNEEFPGALAFAIAANDTDQPSSAAQAMLADAAYQNPIVSRTVFDSFMWRVAPHPNGQHVLLVPSDGKDKLVWDPHAGEVLQRFDADKPEPIGLRSGAMSPDGAWAVFGQDDGLVVIYDVATGEEIRRLDGGYSDLALDMAFSPDGSYLVVGYSTPDFRTNSCTGSLVLWNMTTSHVEREFEDHASCIANVDYSADGHFVITAGSVDGMIVDNPGVVRAWEVDTAQLVKTFGLDGNGHQAIVNDVILTRDGQTLVSVGWDSALIFWDFETQAVIKRIDEAVFNPSVATLSLSQDDSLLALTGDQNQVVLYDMFTQLIIRRLPRQPSIPVRTVFLDNHTILSSAGPIDVYDLRYGAEQERIMINVPSEIASNGYWNESVSPDNSRIILTTIKPPLFSTDDHPIQHTIHDLHTGQVVATYHWDDLQNAVNTIWINSESALTLLDDGLLIVWDVDSGEEEKRLNVEMPETGLVIERVINDDVVLIPDMDRTELGAPVVVFNLNTNMSQQYVQADHAPLTASLSPNGEILLTGGKDGQLIQWGRSTGEVVRTLDTHTDWMLVGDIDADRMTALSFGMGEGVLKQWDLNTGELLRRFVTGNTSNKRFSWFTDLGIVFKGQEGIQLLDESTGQVLRTWQTEYLNAMQLSEATDSSLLLKTRGDTTLTYAWWRLDTYNDLRTWAQENRYAREFTCEEREIYRLDTPCQVETGEEASQS